MTKNFGLKKEKQNKTEQNPSKIKQIIALMRLDHKIRKNLKSWKKWYGKEGRKNELA